MKKISHYQMSKEMVEIISSSTNKIHERIIDNLTPEERHQDNFNELSGQILSEIFLSISAITNYIYLEKLENKNNIIEITKGFYNELACYLDILYDEENKIIAIHRINKLSKEYSNCFDDNDYFDKIVKIFTKIITKTRMEIPYDVEIPDGLEIIYSTHLYLIIRELLSGYLLSLEEIMTKFKVE